MILAISFSLSDSSFPDGVAVDDSTSFCLLPSCLRRFNDHEFMFLRLIIDDGDVIVGAKDVHT
jgi:hypothetical protein